MLAGVASFIGGKPVPEPAEPASNGVSRDVQTNSQTSTVA